MNNQQVFYKTYGVRNVNELASPRLFDLVEFVFPFNSIMHYATYDSIENGPPGDYPLFNQIKKPIYFKTINEISAFNGSPRLQAINTQELVRDYRNNNRRMKLLQGEVQNVSDPTVLTVFNYCILNKQYKYARNLFTDYHRWKNIFTTVIDTLVNRLSSPQINHYIPLTIPDIIPSMIQLDLASKGLNQSNLKVFKDNNSFMLLELWKWLNPATSSDSLFSKIPINRIHLVNLVYIKRNKWCVLNLGVINSFKEVSGDALKPENTPIVLSRVKLKYVQIQKRILNMMMTIEAGSVVAVDIPEDIKLDVPDQTVEEPDIYSDYQEQEVTTEAPVKQKSPLTDKELLVLQEKANQLLSVEDDDDQEIIDQKIKLQDLELDQRLDQLNEINQRKENELQTIENSTIYDVLNEQEPSLYKLVENMCDRLADNNMLTAAEYKRLIRLAGSYKTITSKDGKSTLEEYVKIPPEDLVVQDVVNIPDSPAIVDKTMLKSSLQSFTSDYVKKDIIGKDTASMVIAIQKSGMIVTDYKVEKYESILGAEEEHTLRIVPVEGIPSTIRFKVPVVNEDGTFVASGVKYRLRNQIGD